MDLNLSDATAIQTAFVEQLRKQHHLSASHIQRLCGWAHSYAPSHASTLFHCILRHLQDSLPAYKISCLYLLDALLKASLGSSKNLPEDITVSASAKRAYVQLICDNLEVILQEFLLANGSGVDEMSQFASNLLQARKVVGLWISKHGHQLPLDVLEVFDRRIEEALNQIPQDILANVIPGNSAGPSLHSSSSAKQQHSKSANANQQQQHTQNPSEKDTMPAITRRMEDDRDRQKRAREETWALPLPSSVTSSGSFRILTKEQEREMEMEEFEAAWKATTTGLFPEDHAVMRHYQQRYLDAMAEKKPL